MKKNLILSIDQGTSGSTALLMTDQGVCLDSVNVPFKQIFPKRGWVEHNPDDILKSVQKAIRLVLKKTKKSSKEILTIGITNQRETVVFWDQKSGKPYGNAIVWQCKRTSDRTEEIKKNGDDKWIKKTTGLSVDPYFSSSKIEWFLKNKKHNTQNLRIGTIDAFLIWHLTGGQTFATEHSNASRTQLYNLKTGKWDSKLLEFFGVKEGFLPKIHSSNAHFGNTKNFKPLADGISITGVLGDQQSALFGQRAHTPGDVKCTFGTGSFILLNTGDQIVKSKSGLLTTVAWSIEGEKTQYAVEGGAFNCGSCINWFTDELGVIEKSSDIGEHAHKVKDSLGVMFAPTFSGLGAPYWSPETKGAFVGLSRGSNSSHMARAVLEGLSYQNALIFEAMEKDYGKKLRSVFVDGGASRSDVFMDIQSLFSHKKLIRPKNIETTAVGAALMAGFGCGVFDLKSKKALKESRVFNKKASAKDKVLIESYKILFKALRKAPFL